jgi:ribosomal protein S18 acetylase RimI-like enzyme
MSNEPIIARKATRADQEQIENLYRVVASNVGGLARLESEITTEYIAHFMQRSAESGLEFVLVDPTANSQIVAEVHCYQLFPSAFSHMLGELTIAVHPAYQGRGLGKLLFTTLLRAIELERPAILRVELITRESNERGIRLYQSVGFKVEGRLENRIRSASGGLEADIPMAWTNPGYREFQQIYAK